MAKARDNMSMKSATQEWLLAQRQKTRQPALKPRQALSIDGHIIGSIDPYLATQLGEQALAQRGLALDCNNEAWSLKGTAEMTARLNQLAQLLRERGLAGAWRDEQLAVRNQGGEKIATVERAAVRPLGITTRAVHLVGVDRSGAIWVQQRADDKATNPGMWDTLMGGMVSAADELLDALARETWEEAGLRIADLANVQHGGYVKFERPSDEAEGQGFMQERIDWFSATVPEGLQPSNQDGEVQRFELLDSETVEDWLVQQRFTAEASMILAAYLGW